MSDKELEQEILALENEVKRLEDSTKEIIQSIKERIQNLKDIAWDKQSKKESAQMFNVLQGEKESTQVKSNVGDIRVDKDFMQKEIQKHLDNPELRGMVTTQEMLSFPKVAKNVGAEYEEKHKNYTWKAKANDKSVIAYGSREYTKDNKETNRLLTTHSKTESNQRLAEMDRRGHPYHSIFNDFNFRKSANSAINSHDRTKTNTLTTQGSNATSIANENIAQIKSKSKDFNHLSISQRLDILEKNQQSIIGMQNTKDLQQQNKDSINIKQETESKNSKNQESQMRIRKNHR
ncbi:hypothetical protein MKD52_08470 [Helicobacter sp. CaF467b]|uniref:hypothetical protein n=1 Tax=Helicobacter sp. CaF467b TaxID=2919923 RepID=UPI001F57DCE0|nr:hypothetical protein [Helicobacter sp. CaF467b]MCI2236861.1 hypothetical protein [Helicobacter sp. CaF467b]